MFSSIEVNCLNFVVDSNFWYVFYINSMIKMFFLGSLKIFLEVNLSILKYNKKVFFIFLDILFYMLLCFLILTVLIITNYYKFFYFFYVFFEKKSYFWNRLFKIDLLDILVLLFFYPLYIYGNFLELLKDFWAKDNDFYLSLSFCLIIFFNCIIVFIMTFLRLVKTSNLSFFYLSWLFLFSINYVIFSLSFYFLVVFLF